MSALLIKSKSALLKFAVFALAVAQDADAPINNRPKSAVKSGATNNQAMGPIGAGIGFAVLFVGMVLYLCKRDREELKEEQEAKKKEMEDITEVPKGDEEYGAPNAEEGKVDVEEELDDAQRA